MTFASWLQGLTSGFASTLKQPRPAPRARGARYRPSVEMLEDRVVLTAGVVFSAPQNFAVGSNPLAVIVGDFNSDGKLDLASANYSSNDVSVLLGNGNGTFQTQQTSAAGTNPYALAVGDFNLDGKPDLAVTNIYSSSVSVLLGNGNGTFQTPQTLAVGVGPDSVVVADFNADGKPDLAVTKGGPNPGVNVLLGNGDGTFQSPQTFAVGYGSRSMTVADFNADGKPDLAVANVGSSGLSVLLGIGDGTFQGEQHFYTPYTLSIAVGDFNGDGKPDLVAAFGDYSSDNYEHITATVLLGNGNGTFQPPQYVYGYEPFSLSVAVGDFNADGKADLALGFSGVTVHVGNGDGTFQNYAYPVGGPTAGVEVRSVAVGDFNGDGGLDLAYVDQLHNSLGVMLNISPQQQAQALSLQVQNLVTTGVVNQGVANSLTTKLANVTAPGGSGRVKAFINEVQALVKSGRLTKAEGDLLIGSAFSLLASLS